MKTAQSISSAALLVLLGAAAVAAGKSEENESRLAKMLEGRTAGEPVNCITAFRSEKLQVIEDVALVFDAGDTLYVARPTNPDALRRDDVVIINRFGGQLCHTDIIRTVDRQGGYTTGVLFLEKWVPYSKKD